MLEYEHAIRDNDRAAAAPHRAALADQVRQAVTTAEDGAARIVRVTLPVEPVDPLAWLQVQSPASKWYWAGRQTGTAVAGVGVADEITEDGAPVDFERLHAQLSARWTRANGVPLRYVGGLRFDGRADPDARWADFGAVRFVLPRFELRSDGQTATLACHLVLPRDADGSSALQSAISALRWPTDAPPEALPRPSSRTDVPDRAAWIEMIEWALQAIDRGALDKVVLARRSTLDFLDALDPWSVLRHVQAATPGCFHFGFQPGGTEAFIGASPERLFRQDGRHIRTEAIAGTRSRGDSDQADAALREELLASEKDRREHAYVQEAIRAALDPLCSQVDLNQPPSEMKLARGRHLRSRLEGTLREGVTPLNLLRALHPTPAVGGVPAEKACQAIRIQETFDRGWYAGPVGWIEPDAAEFAVALRCGLVDDARLDLFSGAGIVDGSVPKREWDEIEQKISDFAAVLDLDT